MQVNEIKLTFIIDKKQQRVLFAEAGKDFVDLLIHFLSLPVAATSNILAFKAPNLGAGSGRKVGCIRDLQDSIEILDSDYIQPDVNKDLVLGYFFSTPVKLPFRKIYYDLFTLNTTKKLYKCQCQNYVSVARGRCPYCQSMMSTPLHYVDSIGSGYVKGSPTRYMVMDNLEVKSMSTISTSALSLLHMLDVKDATSLVKENVKIRSFEVVKLLKASLETKGALTSFYHSSNAALIR